MSSHRSLARRRLPSHLVWIFMQFTNSKSNINFVSWSFLSFWIGRLETVDGFKSHLPIWFLLELFFVQRLEFRTERAGKRGIHTEARFRADGSFAKFASLFESSKSAFLLCSSRFSKSNLQFFIFHYCLKVWKLLMELKIEFDVGQEIKDLKRERRKKKNNSCKYSIKKWFLSFF